MRIAFISLMEGFPWGGSEELWCKVANLALQEKNEVILSLKKWETVHPKIQQLLDNGAKVHWRQPVNKYNRYIDFIRNKFGIQKNNPWQYIHGLKPDAICINMGGPYDVAYNAISDILLQSKYPYSIIQQFNFENIVLSNAIRYAAKTIFSNAKHVFFVSERNKLVTERNIVAKLTNAMVVSNPANLDNYSVVEFPSLTGKVFFASVARLDAAYKGQDILLEVLSAPKWKSRNWQLNIFGSGPDQSYLEDLIVFFGLENKVQLRGSTNNIREIWQENHLLVMPSIAEGTPLSLIEAMVCGRPSVVTDVGGNSSLVTNGITGFVADACTPKLLDSAMEEAWLAQQDWEAIGVKASKTVTERIDFTSNENIYSNLVS